MRKCLKFIFNNIKFNRCLLITFYLFTIFIIVPRLVELEKNTKGRTLDVYNTSKIMILLFICLLIGFSIAINLLIIKANNYKEKFTKFTIISVTFYCFILALILIITFMLLNSDIIINDSEKILSMLISSYYILIVFICVLYFSFCIRVLNSINVKYSIFITTSVKTMLIAVAAWLVIYRHAQTTIDYSVNILISFFSLLYPILDMYIFVRSEIDKFNKQEKEKYKYDFYNYD